MIKKSLIISLPLLLFWTGCKKDGDQFSAAISKIKAENRQTSCGKSINEVRYVRDTAQDGWLKVQINVCRDKQEKNRIVSIPKYLKVKTIQICNNREEIEILEGAWARCQASVEMNHLDPNLARNPAVNFEYDQAAGLIVLNGMSCKLDKPGPVVPKGTYKIGLPDWPIDFKSKDEELVERRNNSDYARTAFPYWADTQRSLNIDEFTDCTINSVTTMNDGAQPRRINWTDVYNTLINARLDDQHVGTITVK